MRYISLIFVTFLSILILRINFKLHSENYTKLKQKKDIILQLNFLETELKDKNLGERMQHLFPEGYVFIHALYGLAWSELALSVSGCPFLVSYREQSWPVDMFVAMASISNYDKVFAPRYHSEINK